MTLIWPVATVCIGKRPPTQKITLFSFFSPFIQFYNAFRPKLGHIQAQNSEEEAIFNLFFKKKLQLAVK